MKLPQVLQAMLDKARLVGSRSPGGVEVSSVSYCQGVIDALVATASMLEDIWLLSPEVGRDRVLVAFTDPTKAAAAALANTTSIWKEHPRRRHIATVGRYECELTELGRIDDRPMLTEIRLRLYVFAVDEDDGHTHEVEGDEFLQAMINGYEKAQAIGEAWLRILVPEAFK